MRHRLRSRTRALLYMGGALTVLVCMALYALSSQPLGTATVAATQAQSALTNENGRMVFPSVRVENAPASAEQSAAVAGQRAFIDPVTRQLREPTPEEVAALQNADRARTLSAAVSPSILVQNPDGSQTVILSDEHMVYTVATVDTAGKVVVDHATGPAEAGAKMKATPSTQAGKGAGHDR
jgi:hypothetical protein